MENSKFAYSNSWFTKKGKNKCKNSWIKEQIIKEERIYIEFRPQQKEQRERI